MSAPDNANLSIRGNLQKIEQVPTNCNFCQSFLLQLILIVEKHIDEPFFDVKKLLREVGMSRTDLHRKLKYAIGLSATAFIRHIRLQKALKLLVEKNEWSIYQIALEVGFINQSYFTKRFKEAFGCCPIEWRKKNNNMEHLTQIMEHLEEIKKI